MLKHKITQKIGSLILLFFVVSAGGEISKGRGGLSFAFTHAYAQGGGVEFSAQLDQNQIGLDETLTLRMLIQSDGRGNVGQPHFNAPDFDVVQQSSSVSVRSEYDSSVGRFSTVNQTEVLRVLQPKKKGHFKITGIEVRADDQVIRAPDLQVEVKDAVGSSQRQSQNPAFSFKGGRGLHQRLKPQNAQEGQRTEVPFVLRAELDHERAYKGEQVTVSYYLYYQGKILNMEVQKFPELVGFLREDLALPVMGQRLSAEMTTLNGLPYYRSLLLRYALYPLQEGALVVDPLAVKYEYLSNQKKSRLDTDEEDFFFHFFQPMLPQTGILKSEPKTLQVLPLPQTGKPEQFSGGVGEFSVVSAVNQYEVHAHEAITLTLKVEGKGNVSSVKEPQIQWPQSIEVYDSKARVTDSQLGTGSKIFEYLLIPRAPGQYTLPRMELGFFNSKTQSYYVKSSEPITIQVHPALPGAQAGSPPALPQGKTQLGGLGSVQGAPHSGTGSSAMALKEIKPPQLEPGEEFWPPVWRIFYGLFSISLISFLALVSKDLWKKHMSKKKTLHSSSVSTLHAELTRFQEALRSSRDQNEFNLIYREISEFLMNRMDQQFSVHSRSMAREELRERWMEQNAGSFHQWASLEKVLDQLDQVKYSGGAQSSAFNEQLALSLAELERASIFRE